ncbi:MAG: sporulation protein YqfD [Oscillospiraceae bacterium]|jgi:similar to stage IV sporulation protein|nr:sporulation protein YqfD [Oscillospiraceae bacterium]
MRAANYLRGVVEAETKAVYPERFVNICAANDVGFWDMCSGDGVVRASMYAADFRRLRRLSPELGFEVTRINRAGLPFFLRKMRRRHILLAGLAAVFIALRVSAMFVWTITVSGNTEVPSREILRALRESGFSRGTFVYSVKSEVLANDVILKIPELSWLAVNLSGARAEVLVRERVPKPELSDETLTFSVAAAKSGVITKLSVLEGSPLVAVGSTVTAGETLVSGVVADRRGGARAVHALANVEARTWYELSARMPLGMSAKRYTGREKTVRSLNAAGAALNLYRNADPFPDGCDKTVTRYTPSLPGGAALPLTVTTTLFREYELVPATVRPEGAEEFLKRGLERRLLDSVGAGAVLKLAWTVSAENGVMTVTLYAECLEQIAVSVPE